MFFVAGITGRVGGAAARHLLDQGHQVRALVRDPAKASDWLEKGVEIYPGDLTDGRALASALDGVDGAFLMQPTPVVVAPSLTLAKSITTAIRDALDRSPPPRIVVLSSVGSERATGLGNIMQTHLLEQALDDLRIPVAFIRAGAFIENNLGALARAASSGWFDSFLQPVERAFPMVATADIGLTVAQLLIGGWTGRKIVELGSHITPNDLAQGMEAALGRPVRARPIPRERWASALTAMGLPEGETGLWEEMQDGFNAGWIGFGVPGTERMAGTTTPAQVFAEAEQAARARHGASDV